MNGEVQQQLLELVKVLVGAGVLSMAMPLVVSILVQQGWSRPAKEATVLVSSVVVAVLGVIAAGVNPLDMPMHRDPTGDGAGRGRNKPANGEERPQT